MSDRSSLLTDIIYKNPGLHFSEMIRVSGLKNGVLTYYLNKLELLGTIKIKREKDKTRFFSPEISLEETQIIKFLRKETTRRIIFLLIDNSMIFHEIVNKIGKSFPTISQNLSELIDNEIIFFKIENSQKKYFIKKIILLQKLLKKYNFC